MIAHVSNFERKIVGDGVLHIYGPVVHVRSRKIRIDAQDRARSCARYRSTECSEKRCLAHSSSRPPCPAKLIVPTSIVPVPCVPPGPTPIAPVGIVLIPKRIVQRQKGFPVNRLVDHSEAGAEHGLSRSKRIPGDAQTRREIVMVAVVGCADLLAHLLETRPLG